MTTRDRAWRAGGLLLACAALLHAPILNAEWEAVPEITLEAESNDNPGLNTIGGGLVPTGEANRLLADAQLTLRRIEPRGEITFSPRVRGDAYAEDEAQALESTDVFVRSDGVHRGPTVRVGYAADLARERILGVEFLETLPTDAVGDDPALVTTSQVGVNERRTRAGIAPYVEMALNSRAVLRLDGRIVDVDYERDAGGGRTDFLERTLGGEYRRTLDDQRGSLGIRVFAGGYQATSNNNATDTRGFELIFAREASELLSWTVAAGLQRSDFALSTGGRRIRGTNNEPSFAFGIEKQGELSTLRADLRRRLSADSLGFVAPRDEVRLTWQRRLSAKLTGRVTLRAIDAEGVEVVAASDRRYGRGEIDVEWHFSEPWSFVAGYAHATSSIDPVFDPLVGVPPIAVADEQSNALTIGVRYRGRAGRASSLER